MCGFFFLFLAERRTLPHVTLPTISIAINLPFPVGWGLSNESVVSKERRGGVVEMSRAVLKAEWGVSYGHCSTVYITANEARVWLQQDHLHITLSCSLSLLNTNIPNKPVYIPPHLPRLKWMRGGEKYFIEGFFLVPYWKINHTFSAIKLKKKWPKMKIESPVSMSFFSPLFVNTISIL